MASIDLVDEEGNVVEGFSLDPFSLIGRAASGALNEFIPGNKKQQLTPQQAARLKAAVADAKARKKAEAEARSLRGRLESAKQAVAKAKEEGRFQNLAIGAGIGAGAVGLIAALVFKR